MAPSTALDAKHPQLRQLIARYSVSSPRVFGSVLTGTDTAASDLDLLVDPSETTTLFTLASFQDEAEALLGFPVSILTPNALPAACRDRVLADARPL
jgi:predicted nucleotidyltransferase